MLIIRVPPGWTAPRNGQTMTIAGVKLIELMWVADEWRAHRPRGVKIRTGGFGVVSLSGGAILSSHPIRSTTIQYIGSPHDEAMVQAAIQELSEWEVFSI